MEDSKSNMIEPGDKLRSDQSPAGCGEVVVVDISITNIAILEWLWGKNKGTRFSVSRETLKNSSWVKVE